MPEQDVKENQDKGQEVNYGDLAFWIYTIKRINGLPDDIPLSEFYKFLLAKSDNSLLFMELKNEQRKDNPAGNSS